jgi:histidyl-tRNA synthetase
LLSSLGAAEPVAAVGFGFGDAVVYELLKAKGLLPSLEAEGPSSIADVLVYPMEESLRNQVGVMCHYNSRR